MKKRSITLIVALFLLLATPSSALAQAYYFSLDSEKVVVFLNEDGSISLDYTFVFTNNSSTHEIDFVDVGMPSSSFDIEDVSAEVDGAPVEVSVKEYQGKGSGFAVVLGTSAIQPDETGTVWVRVKRITSVLHRDAEDTKYASFKFTPTWFGSEFVHGSTDLTVIFHLPSGIQTEEPRFHLPGFQWRGAEEPVIDLDENGRITYTWHDENANGYSIYTFGASFPLNYVPAYATQLAQPTTTRQTKISSNNLAGCIFFGAVLVIIIGAVAFLKRSERTDNRLGYLAPQISIEGYGVRRGLTAVEAAIVLEQPLEKILTMILFGIVKKGAAKIVKRDPLQLDIQTDMPEDLYGYERSFLEAFRIEDARNREEKLQEMFIDLIKAVSEKIRGFSQDETQRYYRDIVHRAWQQVQEAGTPDLKNREFDQSFDWLMLNHRFNENVQELFQDPGVRTPSWWEAYDQGFKLSEKGLPAITDRHEEGSSRIDSEIIRERPRTKSDPSPAAKNIKPEAAGLPGADYAASIVNSVQDFSSRVIRDVDRFTDRVHEVTNLHPTYSSRSDEDLFRPRRREESFGEPEERRGGASAPSDGFWSLFGSSDSSRSSSGSHRSSSGSRHSSCACACAGCACACAGGGR